MTELPKPQWLGDIPGYTKDQMLQLRRDALEEAAMVCDEYQHEWRGREYAQAIRKLKDAI